MKPSDLVKLTRDMRAAGATRFKVGEAEVWLGEMPAEPPKPKTDAELALEAEHARAEAEQDRYMSGVPVMPERPSVRTPRK